MDSIVHRAETRGVVEHGWLSSRHTFSFAEYRNPERTRFGLLRVINDDVVEPAQGFGTHPHENMEIISIPLSGELIHHDSMGHTQIIRAGEVQIMSAGTGLTHSEFNASATEPASFLQIWVFPKERDIPPRYDQKAFSPDQRRNRLQNIVTPGSAGEGVLINQDAWFWLGDYEAGKGGRYELQKSANGVYGFVVDGELDIEGQILSKRDGIAIADANSVKFRARQGSSLLLMEIPL